MTFKAEYIWIDGTEPTARVRSKTKVLPDGADLPIWGFDGSSTNQAPGSNSDCVLRPVFSCPDPIRGGDDNRNVRDFLADLNAHVRFPPFRWPWSDRGRRFHPQGCCRPRPSAA